MKMGLPTLLGRKLAEPMEFEEVEELSCAHAAHKAFLAQQELCTSSRSQRGGSVARFSRCVASHTANNGREARICGQERRAGRALLDFVV